MATDAGLEVQTEGPGSPSNAPEAPDGGLCHPNVTVAPEVDLRPSIVTLAPNVGLELEVLVPKAGLKKEGYKKYGAKEAPTKE